MTAEIFDLRSKVGWEAYLNHLRREMDGQETHEIVFNTIVAHVQHAAVRGATDWMEQFGGEQWRGLSREECIEVADGMIKAILEKALSKFDENKHAAEKYLGKLGDGLPPRK